jgi:hypothetical protein
MGLTNMGLLRDKITVGHHRIAFTLHWGYNDEYPAMQKGCEILYKKITWRVVDKGIRRWRKG